MKIGTQLKTGLSCILLCVALLSGMALYQSDYIWQQLDGLYNHPLATRRAMSELRFAILNIHLNMQDALSANTPKEAQKIFTAIDSYDADAVKQLNILYTSYLGPRGDLDTIRDLSTQWKTIRGETSRLMRQREYAEAARRLKPSGEDGAFEIRLINQLERVSEFALRKSDQYYGNAKQRTSNLRTQLTLLLIAIFGLSLIVSHYLLKAVKSPIQELMVAAKAYRDGNFSARSAFEASNEFGELSTTFNELAATIQAEMFIKEENTKIVAIMLADDEPHAFCRSLLAALLQETTSQIGAIFLLNEAESDFELFESIGLDHTARTSFSALTFEGEFGPALSTKQIHCINDIPAGTRHAISTVSGSFLPAAIITIPIPLEQRVTAMISLAALTPYSETARRLIQNIWHVMTARMNSVLALRKISQFSEKLEFQNRELEAQKREITLQKDELTEQNVELELQKNQLNEANRLKSSFLSNMSHELRTPLNSVIALSGVLNRRLASVIPREEYEYLEIIERNGRNLLELINDILDLSRIEAGREEINLQLFAIEEPIAEIVAMLEYQAREKGIALVARVEPHLPNLFSDYAKCRHILQNLISNAVKFTERGQVTIQASHHDGTIRIAVIDTGIGIAPGNIELIFDEFRQVDESTTKNHGGTGLGLAIANKYATILKGGISVESVPGSGSTFTLCLPLNFDAMPENRERRNTGQPTRSPNPTANNEGQGKTILVVEDNVPAEIQMHDILTGQGYRTMIARNGREALELLESSLPDAIILDLMMPDVDGFEALARIRGLEKTSHIPVLILTAKHVTKEELSFLKSNHIHQLIQKGDVNRNELLRAIATMTQPLPPPAAVPPVLVRTKGRPVILVVENNPDNLKTITAMLSGSCDILEATDGQSGLESAKANQPDLILMDLAMPIMDGFTALNMIRNDEALRHIPVIAVTANAMNGSRERILAHGFDGYLPKPIGWAQLDTILREKLDGITDTDHSGD